MAKYVIRSKANSFVPNIKNWETSVWTTDLNEAKVFESLDAAIWGLNKVADYFKEMGWPAADRHTIHEVSEIKTLLLGSPVHIDDKDTVISIIEAITRYGVESRDVPDMHRIINYVKAKGT